MQGTHGTFVDRSRKQRIIHSPSSDEVDNKKKVRAWRTKWFVRYISESFKIIGVYAKEQSDGDGFKQIFY
jgi:hypothetical protein